METVKNLLAVLAGLAGLATAMLTVYAKYLDVKKAAARDGEVAPPEPTHPDHAPVLVPAAEVLENPFAEPETPSPPPSGTAIERSRAAVRAPAITLLASGLLTLGVNLFMAGFGYVDQFVTPLTEESQARYASIEAARQTGLAPPAPSAKGDGLSEEATVVLTILTFLSLSIASAAAAWAGFGMLRLKSYWLSVAGSFAIMAGGGLCCLLGIPIGLWSLSVLYKPEVAASFR